MRATFLLALAALCSCATAGRSPLPTAGEVDRKPEPVGEAVTDADPSAPDVDAAALEALVNGRIDEAWGLLHQTLREGPNAAVPPQRWLLLACVALEKGELAAAGGAVERLREATAGEPDAEPPEVAMLRALVKARTLDPTGDWAEDALAAWQFAGAPDLIGSTLVRTGPRPEREPVPVERLEGLSAGSAFFLAHTLQGEPGAPDASALPLPGSHPTAARLVRLRAGHGSQALVESLAASEEDNAVWAVWAIVGVGDEPQPLDAGRVSRLEAAVRRPRARLHLALLYQAFLESYREAGVRQPEVRAFPAAVWAVPDQPLAHLWAAIDAAVADRSVPEPRLGAALQRLAESLLAGPSAFERLLGAGTLKRAMRLLGGQAAAQTVEERSREVQRTYSAGMAAESSLTRWPLPSLRAAIVHAHATAEMEWLGRLEAVVHADGADPR